MGDVAYDPILRHLASAAGLVCVWQDVHGQTHHVQEPVLRSLLNALGLPCNSPAQMDESLHQLALEKQCASGRLVIADLDQMPIFQYTGPMTYQITLEGGERRSGTARQTGPNEIRIPAVHRAGYHSVIIGDTPFNVAVAPKRCVSIGGLTGGRSARAWGIAAQVYSLRHSDRSAHIGAAQDWPGRSAGGDFSALATLAREAGRCGASALAISPVHAMFSSDPLRCSPYSPSSRLFLNVAYIDPAIVLGQEAVQSALGDIAAGARSPASPFASIQGWPQVLSARLAVLRRLFDIFLARAPAALAHEFKAFRRQGGQALENHGLYEVLHAHHLPVLGSESGWRDWSSDMHNPAGPVVAAYASLHEREVCFHIFLQWLADRGMQFAQKSAQEAGMAIGLITDLAIGTDPRGSHAWSRQDEMLGTVSVGAPPDLHQPHGQDWGLTAFSPRALRHNAYSAYIETLRAVLSRAGGVRIDHILGLARLWLIPPGANAADGVYLRYPLNDMLRLLTLEAWRRNAIVIGENLGTVPQGFNRKLEEKGILGTNVLWFEREAGGEAADSLGDRRAPAPGFTAPARWAPLAMATATTHDLPTINGWWGGRDLQWREQLGQFPAAEATQRAKVRMQDKTALWRALREAGCVSDTRRGPPDSAPRDAILTFVASTPSALFMVSMEDLLGLTEQPNLPGASNASLSSHPNWVQSLPVGVEDIFLDPGVRRTIAALRSAREAP